MTANRFIFSTYSRELGPRLGGAVYRFIDYDGVLIMEVEIGDMKSLELLVIE